MKIHSEVNRRPLAHKNERCCYWIVYISDDYLNRLSSQIMDAAEIITGFWLTFYSNQTRSKSFVLMLKNREFNVDFFDMFLPVKNAHEENRKWKRSSKRRKIFFSMKNAFYSLINVFFAVPHCYGTLFSQFRIVRLMDRKFSDPFFLEWSGKDSIEMRLLSLTFSRETLENGFFELMNAF